MLAKDMLSMHMHALLEEVGITFYLLRISETIWDFNLIGQSYFFLDCQNTERSFQPVSSTLKQASMNLTKFNNI